jgi:hypothetical protein
MSLMEALLADWRFIVLLAGLVGNTAVDKFILWRLWALSEERRKALVGERREREANIQLMATLQANFQTAQEDIAGIGKKVASTRDKFREDIKTIHEKAEEQDRRCMERIDTKINEIGTRFDNFVAQMSK